MPSNHWPLKKIINDDSKVIRMMLQVVVSPTMVILTTQEVSFARMYHTEYPVTAHPDAKKQLS